MSNEGKVKRRGAEESFHHKRTKGHKAWRKIERNQSTEGRRVIFFDNESVDLFDEVFEHRLYGGKYPNVGFCRYVWIAEFEYFRNSPIIMGAQFHHVAQRKILTRGLLVSNDTRRAFKSANLDERKLVFLPPAIDLEDDPVGDKLRLISLMSEGFGDVLLDNTIQMMFNIQVYSPHLSAVIRMRGDSTLAQHQALWNDLVKTYRQYLAVYHRQGIYLEAFK